jgi:hypothetical protein
LPRKVRKSHLLCEGAYPPLISVHLTSPSHTHPHTRTHLTHTHLCAHLHARTHAQTHVHSHKHIHSHARTHACTHTQCTHIRTQRRTCACICSTEEGLGHALSFISQGENVGTCFVLPQRCASR